MATVGADKGLSALQCYPTALNVGLQKCSIQLTRLCAGLPTPHRLDRRSPLLLLRPRFGHRTKFCYHPPIGTDSHSPPLGAAMPFSHQFKPAHKEIKRYHEELAGYATHEVAHEGATSSAFQNLLAATCKKADWHLVPQLSTRTPYVFLCEKSRPSSSTRYTESENGMIGYCAANGVADEVVANLMGRNLDAIKRQRKKLGF